MKFMNMKRFGSIAMAGALALSLTAPAFAESAEPANTTTEITGAYQDIPISVVVPESGTAQINPYGLPVSITKSDGMTSVSIVGQKITTQPLSIRNQGDVALDVNASLLVEPSGDVSIITGNTALGTGKNVKVNLEVAGLDDAKFAVDTMNMSLEDNILDAFVADATWSGVTPLAAPAYSKSGTAPGAAKSGAALAVLGAATDNMGMITYGRNSIAVFRLTGDLNVEPNDGATPAVDTPWAETDGFTATVVFKFTPHQAVAASVSLDKTTLNVASGSTGTIEATYDAGESGLTVTKYDWASDNTAVASVSAGGTASATSTTVTNAGAGTANVTVTVTLSDNSTVTATCIVTCA